MPSSPSCDYCRATIDPRHADALIVAVHRGVDPDEWDDDGGYLTGNTVQLRFCNQAHAAALLQRAPLPAGDDEAQEPWLLACLLIILVGLAVMSLAGYGLVQLAENF